MNQELAVLDRVQREMDALPGHTGLYYKNLATGFTHGIRHTEAFLAASVIKLPLYLHILSEAQAGRLSMEQKITVTEADMFPICGALPLMTPPIDTDLRSLCRLMISLSDNTATNKLIRLCGLEAAQEGFRQMRLTQSVLRRELFDSEAAARGLENTVSPEEMGLLLERLYTGKFLSPAVSQEAIDTLLSQQICHKLGGKLSDLSIANKTGEDENLSNDVGIVYAPQPFILCCTGHDTSVPQWEDLIRRAAYDLYRAQL